MDFQGFPKGIFPKEPEARLLADFRGSERGEHRNLIKQTNIKHATEEDAEEDQTLASGEEGSEKTEGEGVSGQEARGSGRCDKENAQKRAR